MGDDWDDDDEWDDDAIEQKLQAQLKEKEKERRREEGLDSESEEEKPNPAAQAPKPKPKPKPKKEERKAEEPKLSAEEEKLRRQKLVEEADARLAQDLFAGIEATPKEDKKAKEEAERKAKEEEENNKREAAKPTIIYNDAYEKVELKVQADLEKLSDGCVKKVEAATAKGGAVRFLSDLLKQLDQKLDTQDVNELTKLISDMVHQKKVSKGATDAKNNKANNKLSKTTKFNAASEWEEVYGGGAGDEEWTQEEWDEWEKKQAAEWAATQGQ